MKMGENIPPKAVFWWIPIRRKNKERLKKRCKEDMKRKIYQKIDSWIVTLGHAIKGKKSCKD